MSDEETPGAAGPVGVMVEMRVPKEQSAAAVASTCAFGSTSFTLDGAYQPVPVTPLPDMAPGLESAGEVIVLVRGTVAEDEIADLEADERVVKVWRDSPVIEPFGGC